MCNCIVYGYMWYIAYIIHLFVFLKIFIYIYSIKDHHAAAWLLLIDQLNYDLRWFGTPSYCDVLPIEINDKIKYTKNQLLFTTTLFCDWLLINWVATTANVQDQALSRPALLKHPYSKDWFAARNFSLSLTSRKFLAS